MNKQTTKKIFAFMQAFLALGAGSFALSYFTQTASATVTPPSWSAAYNACIQDSTNGIAPTLYEIYICKSYAGAPAGLVEAARQAVCASTSESAEDKKAANCNTSTTPPTTTGTTEGTGNGSGSGTTSNTTSSGCGGANGLFDCIHYKTLMPQNIVYGGVPTALVLGHTYTFTIHETIKEQYTSNPKDTFGIEITKVLQSPKGTNLSVTDNNITIAYLSAHRHNDADDQQVVNSKGEFFQPNGWAEYMCATKTVNNVAGTSFSYTCTFTPSQIGFYQIDADSLNYFNNGNVVKNCWIGECGPIGGGFFKVVKPTPTPTVTQTPTTTPTHTPTPTPTTTVTTTIPQTLLTCANIKVTEAGNTQDLNGTFVSPIQVNGEDTNQSRMLTAVINGNATSDIKGLKVNWTVIGKDENTNTLINESSVHNVSITQTGSTNSYSDTNSFTFGPFDGKGVFNATDITGNHQYMFSVQPAISDTKGHLFQIGPVCNAQVTTKSAASVLPTHTTANIAITKQLDTAEPILVGQNANFKVVVTNTGMEDLTSINFHDDFGSTGVMNFVSATLAHAGGSTINLPITASNGTTSGVDLLQVVGLPKLVPNDTLTVELTFVGQIASENDTDVACVSGVSTVSGATVSACDHASVLFSSLPVSPNTGASTPITLGALLTFLGTLAGKKYVLKFLGL